jgi:hypothetical protein
MRNPFGLGVVNHEVPILEGDRVKVENFGDVAFYMRLVYEYFIFACLVCLLFLLTIL